MNKYPRFTAGVTPIFLLMFVALLFAQERLSSIVKQVQPSVVTITTYDESGSAAARGSGFFVTETGDVITNRHVLEGFSRAEIKTADGASYSITGVVADDPAADLVQVSVNIPKNIPKPLSVAKLPAEVGDRVLVIGSPLGLEQTASDGIVSAVRTGTAEFGGTIIQITAPISPGSSGSPVIDMKGQVIGVATFQITKGQNLNFAIPVEKLSAMKVSRTLAEWGSETLQARAKRGIAPAPSIDANIVEATARFYRGRTVRILVGFSAGSGFDTYSRLMARNLGKHIPGNPSIIVENMPGAGSLVLANYIYNRVTPDGLTIGHFHGNLLLMRSLGLPEMEVGGIIWRTRVPLLFDARRLEYIGAPLKDHVACVFTNASGITSKEKWMAAQTAVRLGGVASGSAPDNTARILKEALGLPIELISGYRDTVAIGQAVEKGDLAGGCWDWNSIALTWRNAANSGQVVVVLQAARKAHPDLPKVPLAIDLAKTEDARHLIEVGIHAANEVVQPYVLPPGTPKELVRMLRNGFENTMRDPQFLVDIDHAKLRIDLVQGQEIETNIGQMSNLKDNERSKLNGLLFK